MDFKNIKNGIRRPDYSAEVASILRSDTEFLKIREQIERYHENDIAGALEILSRNERSHLYNILTPEVLSDVLEHSGHMSEYIDELSFDDKVHILSVIEAHAAVEYLIGLEYSERHRILSSMSEEVQERIYLLSSFAEEEIGSRMSTNYISVRSGSTIREAMKELIRQAADNDNISTIYVVGSDNTLKGAIDLKDLIIARAQDQLDAITSFSYPYVYYDEYIDECIEKLISYSEDSIPVIDKSGRLTGVITSQDIAKLNDMEMEDDYAKLGGLSEKPDYIEPLSISISKRLPWLMILLLLGLLVSNVVGMFENIMAHITLIVSFQSLILDMSGNVGTQSLAVTIRVLMDKKIKGREKLALVGRETRIGLANGLILGLLSFSTIGVCLMIFKGQTAVMSFSVSFCAGVSLMISMMLSSISGTMIPIMFEKFGIDPAVASGPLITTVNDLVAVITYYSLSWFILINILHI